MSLENLFRMRPIGVDSKNCIVDLKRVNNMVSCKYLDDVTANLYENKTSAKNENKSVIL